ncbi:MAG: hypothetical protein WBE00_02605 [Phycisphaerae bacterium]
MRSQRALAQAASTPALWLAAALALLPAACGRPLQPAAADDKPALQAIENVDHLLVDGGAVDTFLLRGRGVSLLRMELIYVDKGEARTLESQTVRDLPPEFEARLIVCSMPGKAFGKENAYSFDMVAEITDFANPAAGAAGGDLFLPPASALQTNHRKYMGNYKKDAVVFEGIHLSGGRSAVGGWLDRKYATAIGTITFMPAGQALGEVGTVVSVGAAQRMTAEQKSSMLVVKVYWE